MEVNKIQPSKQNDKQVEEKAWENKRKIIRTIQYREKRVRLKKKQIPEKLQCHKILLLHHLFDHHIIQTTNPL